MAVLQQIMALKGAVNGLMKKLLEAHLCEHLGSKNLTAKRRKEEVEQVIILLKSYLK
ncbi:metal-sensing transcriptional repressor [Thalassotalea castellviae]|uniref:Metal-sensing transcriptional repressor n=1 Tax=Thalassotalea castellviae TaxID=3075612 RepID=A0ABU3A3V0_9GAMM|nr:metal-sensing transcriptional repressor [Thalassotalea sp. W431]MDT0604856.1 metal-sensing transcriptional repressor [Thalassotalea sp. W431]